MKLSLSVRIVEAPCKTKLFVPFEELVLIAKETGYQAVCLRASAGGVDTSKARLAQMRRCVEDAGLFISMVTADFNVPLNNDQGPQSLRNIGPSLDVAETVGCTLIRVCLKSRDDIPFARQAAVRAAQRGIRLAHQCHTTSLFEEVEPMLKVVAEIGQPNFGLIYEPANLLINGQSCTVCGHVTEADEAAFDECLCAESSPEPRRRSGTADVLPRHCAFRSPRPLDTRWSGFRSRHDRVEASRIQRHFHDPPGARHSIRASKLLALRSAMCGLFRAAALNTGIPLP